MDTSTALLAAVSGLGLGAALIVAIGPQNAFVLRQGLRGQHLPVVVAICVASDLALIAAVVAGAGVLVESAPWLVTGVRWVGAAYLAGFAVLAARRALRPGALEVAAAGSAPLRTTVLATLAMTWLNPHIYVDTVLVLGPVAASHGAQRWAFGAGAVLASALWFSGLAGAARLLRPAFARPATWRALDVAIAVVMAVLAVGLVAGG